MAVTYIETVEEDKYGIFMSRCSHRWDPAVLRANQKAPRSLTKFDVIVRQALSDSEYGPDGA